MTAAGYFVLAGIWIAACLTLYFLDRSRRS